MNLSYNLFFTLLLSVVCSAVAHANDAAPSDRSLTPPLSACTTASRNIGTVDTRPPACSVATNSSQNATDTPATQDNYLTLVSPLTFKIN